MPTTPRARKAPQPPPKIDWSTTPNERRNQKEIALTLTEEARELLDQENEARGGTKRHRSAIVSEALVEKLGRPAKKKRTG